MKKSKINLLIISSLLLSISLTSCSQTIFEDYVQPFRITIELANYHIVNNEVTSRYVEVSNRRYYHYQRNFYSRDKALQDGVYQNDCGVADYPNDVKNRSIGGSISWDTDYGHNTPKNNNCFLLQDTTYHTYNWFKINLTEMKDVQLNYVAGYISYFDWDEAKNGSADNGWEKVYSKYADDNSDGLKIMAYFFPTKDDATKVYNYVSWRVNDFFDNVVYEFCHDKQPSKEGYGYSFDSSTNTITGPYRNIQDSEIDYLKRWKEDQLTSFKELVETSFEENGAYTTSEIISWLNNFETNLGTEIVNQVLIPYKDAYNYWYKLYKEKDKEINDRYSQINKYNSKINTSNYNIARYEQKIEDLKQENLNLEDAIVQDERNANEAYSQYLEFVTQAESLRVNASKLRDEATDIRNKKSEVDNNYKAELNSAYINLRNAQQDYDNDPSERNAEEVELAQIEYDKILAKIENEKEALEQEALELEQQAEDVEGEAKEVDNYAKEYEGLYYSHILSKVNHQNQIETNLKSIATYEQLILNEYSNIEYYKEEIARLKKEIEELIPYRDEYYNKYIEWWNIYNNLKKSLRNTFNALKKERDNYYQELINDNYKYPTIQDYEYNNEDRIKIYGLDQPDIWCFGKTITPIKQDRISKISDYASPYYAENKKIEGDTATLLPFSIMNNGSMSSDDEERKGIQYAFPELANSFTFPEEMNNCTLLVKIGYPTYLSKHGKTDDSIDLALGNIHFVPSGTTYDRDLENEKYDEWEIEMMKVDPEGKKKK